MFRPKKELIKEVEDLKRKLQETKWGASQMAIEQLQFYLANMTQQRDVYRERLIKSAELLRKKNEEIWFLTVKDRNEDNVLLDNPEENWKSAGSPLNNSPP